MKEVKVSVGSVVKNCEFCIAMFSEYEVKYAVKYHDKFHLSHKKLEEGKIKRKTFQGHCNRLVDDIVAEIRSERYLKQIKEHGDSLSKVVAVAIDPKKIK